jgi:ERCC4-type nuclease
MLTIDRRELDLIRALAEIPHKVQDLPVGDVLCEYGEVDGCWVAERKRANDLAASLTNGRLFDQTARLHGAGYNRIFWFVEGDLHSHSVSHECLLGACVNMALRKHSILIRTSNVEETAAVIQQLLSKGRCTPGVPTGAAAPIPLTKRKRDQDKDMIYHRMLQCIPTISERIAKKISERFDTMPALQRALEHPNTFPTIRLDNKHCLGKARLRMLRNQLCDCDLTA